MQYSQTYERGKPYWDRDSFEGRKGPKPNKRLLLPMIPLGSILAGEPGSSQQVDRLLVMLDAASVSRTYYAAPVVVFGVLYGSI